MQRSAIAYSTLRRNSICIAVLVTCMVASDSVVATVREFTMTADGSCTGSSTTGTGTFTLDTETGEVSFDISMVGLTPSVQHIHAPATNCTEAFGAPAWVFLPTGTQVSGTYQLKPYLQGLMLQGKHWFLVHTEAHDAGEILGQLVPLCLNDCTGNGTCDLGVCACDPGWTGPYCSIVVVIPTVSGWGLTISALLTLTCACVLLRTRGHRSVA